MGRVAVSNESKPREWWIQVSPNALLNNRVHRCFDQEQLSEEKLYDDWNLDIERDCVHVIEKVPYDVVVTERNEALDLLRKFVEAHFGFEDDSELILKARELLERK